VFEGELWAVDTTSAVSWPSVSVESYEQAQLRQERHGVMRRFLGAVMAGDGVRYWPPGRASRRRDQRLDHRPQVIRAGMMDWTRGRRWDRRHRYGVK